MSYATTQISAAQHIARAAEQQIKVKTGMCVTLVLCPSENTRKSPDKMLKIIAGAVGMRAEDLSKRSRERSIVELRFLSALLLRRYYPTITLKQIALLFGGQDHTSVMNALIKANNLLDTNDLSFTNKYNTALNTIDQWLKEQ